MSISPVFISQVNQSEPTNPTTKLRDLNSFEEFFWLLEQSVSVFHTVVVQVNGPTTIEQWWEAMEAVQVRYPFLSATIKKIPGKRPFFKKEEGSSIPFRIAPLTDSLVLEQEMENEFQKSFGDGSDALTRASLFYAQDRSVILFSTHHSSLDGKSHLLIIQDLLAHIAGESLGKPFEMPPSLAQLLGLPAPADYTKKMGDGPTIADEGIGIKLPSVRVQHLQLSVEETEVLVERAKREETTVHAAIVVALALAGKRYPEKWNVDQMRCMSPIDLRKTLSIPDAAGLLIGGHSSSVPTQEASFWSTARAVKKDMTASDCLDEARERMGGLSSMVAEEHNPRNFYSSVVGGPMAHELLVTNYAGYKVRTKYGNLKINNLFTGGPAAAARQKVSVLTVNGRLGMTLVARDPLLTLLNDAREILSYATRD